MTDASKNALEFRTMQNYADICKSMQTDKTVNKIMQKVWRKKAQKYANLFKIMHRFKKTKLDGVVLLIGDPPLMKLHQAKSGHSAKLPELLNQ